MRALLFSLVLIVTGCSSVSEVSQKVSLNHSDTMEIIRSAAEIAPNKVAGEYVLNIKATGRQGGNLYLNTEQDYRDQRNVTVAVSRDLVSQLYKTYGANPLEFFKNKQLQVKGEAQRVKINLYAEGKQTGKYYYQTHIKVNDLSQLKIIES